MNKNIKTILTAAMAATLLAGSITACGNSSNASADASASASEAASTDTTVSDSASTGYSFEKTVYEIGKEGYLTGVNASDYVELGDYKNLTAEATAPSVSDDLVDMYINYYFMSGAPNTEITDRDDVQSGDIANIDYVGKMADTGEEFDGGSATGYDLAIGSGTFIPGFEDGLIGKKKGETVDIPLTFPESYANNADLAGKDVIFTVTINKISKEAELTDDLAAAFGITGVTTVDGLKTYVKEALMNQATTSYENSISTQLVNAIQDKTVFQTPPQDMINRFKMELSDAVTAQANQYAAQTGTAMDPGTVLQSMASQNGYSGDPMEYLEDMALSQSKMLLMFKAIAEAEGIEVDENEFKANEVDMLAGLGYSSMDEYSETAGLDMEEVIREESLANAVMEYLRANATITEPVADTADSAEAASAEEASSEASAEAATEAASN